MALQENRRTNMKYNCDYCGKEFNIKPSQLKKQKTACCSKQCSNKLKEIIYKGENNPNYNNRGFNNPLFKGEKTMTDDGYILIYMPDHPFSNNSGRIREHRYIAEKYLAKEEHLILFNGIYVLNPNLDVHHKDGDKTNNNIDNLEILTRNEHAKIHQGYKHREFTVVKTCKNCGNDYVVIKSRDDSSYFCSQECVDIYRKKDMIITICPVCGKEISHSKSQTRICCSVECSNIYNNRGTINFLCDYCGKESKMKKSRFEKSRKHYCCSECYHNDRKSK